MQLNRYQLGQVATNCYIFWDEVSGACAIIDPADSGEGLAAEILRQDIKPVAILLTHGHFDHILGIKGLRAEFPDLPIYCHPADIPEETTANTFGFEFPTVAAFAPVTPYGDGDRVEIGPYTVEVIHTPGHTKGSVTLKLEDMLFTGDTLFKGSVGRTDLPGGSLRELLLSLAKLGRMEGNYKVFPGHDRSTTLETERLNNYYLQEALRRR